MMSPSSDLAAAVRWQESLRRSRERRATAWRRRRHRLRGRTLVLALIASLLAVSGVALAATTGATSPGASAPSLSAGSTGSAVKKLQRKLHVQASGYYGPETRRAVKRYQAAHGLTADGVAGPQTLRALGIRVRQASYATGGTSYSGGTSSSRVPAVLQRIAQCESGGNPRAVSASGRYRGKYQFDLATWHSAGGSGDPAKAPESVQDRIALALYRREGTKPWPNCGRA